MPKTNYQKYMMYKQRCEDLEQNLAVTNAERILWVAVGAIFVLALYWFNGGAAC